MRPVNLIPAEDRRGPQATLRSGPLLYIVIGLLVAALAGVTAIVLTNNEISDRKDEVVRLRHEDAIAKARAVRLSPYTTFRSAYDERITTVSSLADSRFDWERVMRELSLVLPSDVWLTSLTATASPGVTIDGGSSGGSASGLRDSAPGPAMEIYGCTIGQDAVAGFVTALKDIDGVTRVGVQSAEIGEEGGGAGVSSGSSAGGSVQCRTRGFIAEFEIVVAFDAAPVPISAEAGETSVVAPTEEASGEEGSGEEGSETSTTASEG
jgi:Tfp pilus assembly protein PilN